MKKLSILAAIALMAIIYSCGNGGNRSNEQNTDSVATARQANNEQSQKGEQPSMTEQKKVELYKYFSKEEIGKKMQHALSILEKAKKDEDDPFFSDFLPLYKDLLKEDGWNISPDALEAKWSKPITKKEDSFIYEADNSKVHVYEYTYSNFNLTLHDLEVNKLSTSTVGFGFAGVYVGIPECNKAFIEKLFAKAPAIDKNNNEWNISISLPTQTNLNITFNPDETVKTVAYSFGNYAD